MKNLARQKYTLVYSIYIYILKASQPLYNCFFFHSTKIKFAYGFLSFNIAHYNVRPQSSFFSKCEPAMTDRQLLQSS